MLKERIKNKEKLIGMYIQLSDINISRIAALAGYDYVWVDTEHSFISFEDVLKHILVLKTTNTPVIVRLPKDDLTATKRILEMGVDGVIFPMVTSAEEANRVIRSTMYPPYGDRGFGPVQAIDFGLKDVNEYIKNNHNELCRFIQIEHKDTLAELDTIMENEYIDGYIFGANDLSGSYNKLGEAFSEPITQIIKDTVKRLHDKGKYVGIASGGYSDEVVKHWCSFDVEMITAGADFEFLRDGAIRNRINLEKIHKNIG